MGQLGIAFSLLHAEDELTRARSLPEAESLASEGVCGAFRNYSALIARTWGRRSDILPLLLPVVQVFVTCTGGDLLFCPRPGFPPRKWLYIVEG